LVGNLETDHEISEMDGFAGAQQDFPFRINSKRTELEELFDSLVFRSPT
jgi:hypothetical protein